MSAVTGRGRADRSEPESPNYRLTELERRVDKIIQYGTIEEVDDEKHLYRARVGKKKDTGTGSSSGSSGSSSSDMDDPKAGYLTGWSKYYVASADDNSIDHKPIAKGAQVTIVSPGGDPAAQAFLLPGMYQKKFPAWSKDPKVRGTQFKDKTQDSYNVDTGERVTSAKKKRTTQVGKYKTETTEDGTHKLTIGDKAKRDGSGKSKLDTDMDGAQENSKKTVVTHKPNGEIEWKLGDKMTALWNDGKINFKLGEKMLAEMIEGAIKFNTGASKGEIQILENAVHAIINGGVSKFSLLENAAHMFTNNGATAMSLVGGIAKLITNNGANSVTLANGAITLKNEGGGSIGLSIDGTALLNSLLG